MIALIALSFITYLLLLLFPSKNFYVKEAPEVITLSLLSGISNAVIIFLISSSLGGVDNLHYILYYFLVAAFIYIFGRRTLEVRLAQIAQLAIKNLRETIFDKLFDSIVVIENYPMDQLLKEMEGSIKVQDYSMVEETNYEMTFSISVFDGIELNVLYQNGFDDEVINRLLSHYEQIITGIIANPNGKLSGINMISKDEEHLILDEFNNTQIDYPREKTIQQLFEEQVEQTPDQRAVVFENQFLTYKELNEKSNPYYHDVSTLKQHTFSLAIELNYHHDLSTRKQHTFDLVEDNHDHYAYSIPPEKKE